MKVQLPALLQLHCAVLLFALAGLFAKWLALHAFWLVLGRTGFAALTLFIFLGFVNRSALIAKKADYRRFLVSGALLAIHWLTFFLAIQLSSVTFGLLIFASFPIFTLLLTSISERTKPTLNQLLQAFVIMLGVVLLTADQANGQTNITAMLYGLFSALTFAGLLSVNKSLVHRYQASTVACYQNLVAFVCCLPLIILYAQPVEIVVQQLPQLILLGVVFTAFSHSLLNSALGKLTTFAVGLAICLEPVYGSIAAIILLNEQPSMVMIFGGALIVLVNSYQALTSNH